MIKFFGLLFLGFVQVLAKPSPIEPHVVGGTPAEEGTFPWVVSVRDAENETFCGGALISNKYVLTAAHCLLASNKFLVGVGSVHLSQQKVYSVEKYIRHPDYFPTSMNHDIGFLKLKDEIEFSDIVKPIEFRYTENLDLKNVTAMGWGRTSVNGTRSEHLLYVKKWLIGNKECRQRIKGSGFQIYKTNVCATSDKLDGVCFGDSGSPLIYRENDQVYTVGVVSWGIPCALGNPDVFARVQSYIEWIESTIKE